MPSEVQKQTQYGSLHIFLLETSHRPWLHLFLSQGLALSPGLALSIPERLNLTAHCSSKRHAKGNTKVPQYGSHQSFLLGTSVTPMWILMLSLGLGLHLSLWFRPPHSSHLQALSSCKMHAKCSWLPQHGSLHNFLLSPARVHGCIYSPA